MSIGEVLAHLRPDFPDTTISKLRFLEAEGLVEPSRTAAGYRKYSAGDLARLRYVLTAQRDHYLPLRVIREQLDALDRDAAREQAPGAPRRSGPGAAVPGPAGAGTPGELAAAAPRLRPALSFLNPRAEPASADRFEPDGGGEVRLSRAELVAHAGIGDDTLAALEQYGLIAERPGGGYDADALDVATAAARLAEYGLEARHLRAYRAAADREIGLFTQLVAPLARQGGPAARARAADRVRELAGYTERLHAALVRRGLRETLGR
jgi:DNA-binding transcriptional MerR regulator